MIHATDGQNKTSSWQIESGKMNASRHEKRKDAILSQFLLLMKNMAGNGMIGGYLANAGSSGYFSPGNRVPNGYTKMFLIALSLLLVACTPGLATPSGSAPAQQYTQQPAADNTSIPTHTATFALTDTPTPQPTATCPPTATPTRVPIDLSDIGPHLLGVGEHGAMICLTPDNPIPGLDYSLLKANISQDGSPIERNISSQNMGENGTCFELLDANYNVGSPVSLLLNVTGRQGSVINNSFELGLYGVLNQISVLDHYPFLRYIYPGEIDSMYLVKIFIPGRSDQGYHPALDFSPNTNSSYPSLADIPVLSPVTGKVFQVGMDDPYQAGEQRVNNIIIESQYTGWLVTLGHMANRTPGGDYLNSYCTDQGLNLTWTDCPTILTASQPIGYMFLDPNYRGNTHIHLAVTNPAGEGIFAPGDINNIDPTYLFVPPPNVPSLLNSAQIILTERQN